MFVGVCKRALKVRPTIPLLCSLPGHFVPALGTGRVLEPNQLGGHFRGLEKEVPGGAGSGGSGGGWRMKKEQVLHCQFSAWYSLFRSVTIKR